MLKDMRENDRKAVLRAQLKAQRAALDPAVRSEADARIAAHLFALDAWHEATTVLTYLSFGSEVDTRAIIERGWSADKTVALPRCVPNTRLMRWHRVTSLDAGALTRSSFGVEEPADDPNTLIDPTTCDPARTIALVPGLTFDAHGFRLGYGSGFYDTFLATFPGTSIGLIRAAQLTDDLCAIGIIDTHDLPVDIVVSD